MLDDLPPLRSRIRRASPARLRAMAARIAAPLDDDEAAADDLLEIARAAEKLSPVDQDELTELIRRKTQGGP